MNRTQQRLIGVYIPVTGAVILLDLVLRPSPLMWLLKYLVVLSLFLVSFALPKRTKAQELFCLSLFFVAAGDAFLYLPLALGHARSSFLPQGMVMFLLAYACLILVYGQGMGAGSGRLLFVLPALAVFFLGVLVLPRGDARPFGGLVPIFLGVLCTMLWTALCTLSKRSPCHRNGKVIALSGVLMVVCDAGVGLGLFYPHPPAPLYSIASSIIWSAYLSAWTLILWLVAEERPPAVPEKEAGQGDGAAQEAGQGPAMAENATAEMPGRKIPGETGKGGQGRGYSLRRTRRL